MHRFNHGNDNLILNDKLLREAYDAGRRQGLNEQAPLPAHVAAAAAARRAALDTRSDSAACRDWGGGDWCGTMDAWDHGAWWDEQYCPPGSECAPCRGGAESCRSDTKAPAGCHYVWGWEHPGHPGGPPSGRGWFETLVCVGGDAAAGGHGGGLGLGEQLQQTYQSGRRQGLNEQAPLPAGGWQPTPSWRGLPLPPHGPHGGWQPDLGTPGHPKGPDIPQPDYPARPYARPVCSATGCWQTYRGLNGEWYWQWVPY